MKIPTKHLITITLLCPIIMSGMESKEYTDTKYAKNITSHYQSQITPRQPYSNQKTPANDSYIFNEFINAQKNEELIKVLPLQNFLPSYGPAILLRSVLNGEIPLNSPIATLTNWESYNPQPINKLCLINTALYITRRKMLGGNNLSKKHTDHFSNIYNHLYGLKFSILASPTILDELITVQNMNDLALLKDVYCGQIPENSPFASANNWKAFQPQQISKVFLMEDALVLAELNASNRDLSLEEQKRFQQIHRKLETLQLHISSLY